MNSPPDLTRRPDFWQGWTPCWYSDEPDVWAVARLVDGTIHKLDYETKKVLEAHWSIPEYMPFGP